MLTNGRDPGLRSPLADQLALAACLRSGVPTTLLIAAPGIDGEIAPDVLAARLTELHSTSIGEVTAEDVARIDRVLRWHPTEASGLLAAAALGLRGTVEIRDAGDRVELTDATPALLALDASEIVDALLARELTDTSSLNEAEKRVFELTGLSEIRYEAEKASRLARRRAHMPTTDDLPVIDRLAREAAARGAYRVHVPVAEPLRS